MNDTDKKRSDDLVKLAMKPLAELANKFSAVDCNEFEMTVPQGKWYFISRGNKDPQAPSRHLFTGVRPDGLMTGVVSEKQMQQIMEFLNRSPFERKVPINKPKAIAWENVPLDELIKKYGKENIETLAKTMNVVCDWKNNCIHKI